MDNLSKEKQQYNQANNQLRSLKLFYIHFIRYLIIIALLSYNLFILDGLPSANSITWLNVATMVIGTLFIFLYGSVVFKGRLFFGKRWEDDKIEAYIKKNQGNKTIFLE